MKYIYYAMLLTFTVTSANAGLYGAWFYESDAPYDSPYSEYSTVSADVEAVLEDGEVYTGAVIIYEQGIFVVYDGDRRDYVLLEPGLTIEKKGRAKVRLELPNGTVIVGEAASKINGRRLFFREDAPCPRRSFVLVFSDKHNYEPSITRVKSLEIKDISGIDVDDTYDESEELFR